MRLPAGFLDELRDRTSLSRIVGRKVVWDARKSNQGKGDMWAPCPFHQEKTASFHVDDRQGYYYCFGCHAKGDAIRFVRETENVGFIEAVEILTREAGMQMPAQDPKAQEKIDRRMQLVEVMEQAVQFFRLQLKTAAGKPARDYLARRGLSGQALERWEIGFAPDNWQGLWDHLTTKGVAEDMIRACGLAKTSAKGKKSYDTFRNRIMFPIRDARGRTVAFGGRTMASGDTAKYLNSPQTELFDKGKCLYNQGPAQSAARKGKPLIVAEGYMDVIALSQAGFDAAVAPLGTAITEQQLNLMWRIDPEPVIMLDGDAAGLRAAMRLIDLVFPLLEAGRSLRFCLMPEGQDPDDLLKTQGREAMQALLDQASPMVALLWQRETDGKTFDSPERKAALDVSLRTVLRLIRDPAIRKYYGEEIGRLKREFFGQIRARPRPGRSGGRGLSAWVRQPLPSTKNSLLAAPGNGVGDHLRETVILATLVTHPVLLAEFETSLEMLVLAPEHEPVRLALLRHGREASTAALREKIGTEAGPALEKLMSQRHVQNWLDLATNKSPESARHNVEQALAWINADREVRIETEEAISDIDIWSDERTTHRLGQATRHRDRTKRAEHDGTEFEIASNGVALDTDERAGLHDATQAALRSASRKK